MLKQKTFVKKTKKGNVTKVRLLRAEAERMAAPSTVAAPCRCLRSCWRPPPP